MAEQNSEHEGEWEPDETADPAETTRPDLAAKATRAKRAATTASAKARAAVGDSVTTVKDAALDAFDGVIERIDHHATKKRK